MLSTRPLIPSSKTIILLVEVRVGWDTLRKSPQIRNQTHINHRVRPTWISANNNIENKREPVNMYFLMKPQSAIVKSVHQAPYKWFCFQTALAITVNHHWLQWVYLTTILKMKMEERSSKVQFLILSMQAKKKTV